MAVDSDREDLPYTSQAGLYEDVEVPVDDQRDLSTLRKIAKDAEALRVLASSRKVLDRDDPKLSLEQQDLAYDFAMEFLEPLLQTIESAVEKIKRQGR